MCPNSYLYQHLLDISHTLIIILYINCLSPFRFYKCWGCISIKIHFATSVTFTLMIPQRQEVPAKTTYPLLKYHGIPCMQRWNLAFRWHCPSLRSLLMTLSIWWVFIGSNEYLSSLLCLPQWLPPPRKIMSFSDYRNSEQPKAAKPPKWQNWLMFPCESSIYLSLSYFFRLQFNFSSMVKWKTRYQYNHLSGNTCDLGINLLSSLFTTTKECTYFDHLASWSLATHFAYK